MNEYLLYGVKYDKPLCFREKIETFIPNGLILTVDFNTNITKYSREEWLYRASRYFGDLIRDGLGYTLDTKFNFYKDAERIKNAMLIEFDYYNDVPQRMRIYIGVKNPYIAENRFRAAIDDTKNYLKNMNIFADYIHTQIICRD